MARIGHTCAGSRIHDHKALLAGHFARLEAASMHLLLDVHCQPSGTQRGMLSMLVYALQQGSKGGHTSQLLGAGWHTASHWAMRVPSMCGMRGQNWNTSSEAVLAVSDLRQAATARTPSYMQKELAAETPPQAGCHGLLQLDEQQQQLAKRRHCFWAPPPAAAALGCLDQQMQAAATRSPPLQLMSVE